MPSVGNPRDYRWHRLERQRLVAVANSSVSWSLTRTQEYCDRRGIPRSAILSVALGTDPTDWDPGSNSAMEAAFVAPLAALIQARGASGVLLGPGCPARVAVRGKVNGASYTPAVVGYPPLAVLASGAGTYFARLASEVSSFGRASVVAWFDAGSGRFDWYGWDGLLGNRIWGTSPWHQVGSTDTALAPLQALSDATALGSTWIPTTACTQLLGRPESNNLPVGRIGYSGWYVPPSGSPAESDSNALAALAGADIATAAGGIDAPILVSIGTVTSPDGDIWSALVARLREWGYSAQYVYRNGPGVLQESLAPAAGALASTAAWEAGAVTGFGYSMMAGACENTDTPTSAGLGFNTLTPVAGAGVAPLGASSGWEWGLRQLTLGASWALLDQTHKNSAVVRTSWTVPWFLLAGMSVMEAAYWSGVQACYLACGDPLFAPFPANAAQDPLYQTPAGAKIRVRDRRLPA